MVSRRERVIKTNSKKMLNIEKKLLHLVLQFFDEWGNHLMYTMIFLAAVFGLAAFIVIRNINPSLISTDLMYFVAVILLIGIVFLIISIYKKNALERQIRELLK